MKALVVFHNGCGIVHPLAWMLKPGFRHCFVCILHGEMWMKIDGLQGVPSFEFLTMADFDLVSFYREQGFSVIETRQRKEPLVSLCILNNCVGLVKAILCLSAPLTQTPYRLYRYLEKNP